jgi:enoyl-CoA hydratase/carnithine racemase
MRKGGPTVYEQIIYTVTDRIATIALNRPDRLNAWTPVMAQEVRDAMMASATDDEVRVIVLTGAGRGFCAGADMGELKDAAGGGTSRLTGNEGPEEAVSVLMGTPTEEQLDPENGRGARSDFRKRYSYLPSIPKPIIAAINGPAAGLGLIVALYCDLRFASEKARLSTAFSRRGLIAEHGISWLLPRIVGLPNALDLLFSARAVEAREALGLGLVNRVFPEEEFMAATRAYATDLATLVSPRSLRIMKRQLWDAQFQTLAEAATSADAELVLSMESEDFREGVAHFLEKRPPAFTGR